MFVIDMDNVMTMSESKDMETIHMHQTFSIQQDNYFDNKQKKLDRKMGYISTIKETNVANALRNPVYHKIEEKHSEKCKRKN